MSQKHGSKRSPVTVFTVGFVVFLLASCGVASSSGPRSQLNAHRATLENIDSGRELLIRDLSVVNDPDRTIEPCGAESGPLKPWSFGSLAYKLGGENAPTILLQWLQLWLQPQKVNGFVASPRPSVQTAIVNPWLDASGGGDLDLSLAPFRLDAIVYRPDLAQEDSAGEARFVFGLVNTATCQGRNFKVIFEYLLDGDPRDWAAAFHNLSQYDLGSAEYNDALQQLTDLFTANPPSAIRTVENVLGLFAECREFNGAFELTPLDQTPDQVFERPPRNVEVASFINDNEEAILAGTHQLTEEMRGAAIDLGLFPGWNPPGVANLQARHLFASATCNGCHRWETGTVYFHVRPRMPDATSDLSGYLTGITVSDPVTHEPRYFNELQRRAEIMQTFLSP
jgi:hypothetical protein